MTDMIVYHDETRDAGPSKLKAHVLLWVPTSISHVTHTPLFGTDEIQISPIDELFNQILAIRTNHKFDRRFHLSTVSGKRWSKDDLAFLQFSEVAVDALRSKRPTKFKYPLGCKLSILFYPKKSDYSIYGGDKKEKLQRHEETILRMLLKGSAHYLFDKINSVKIKGIVTDGHPMHRSLDEERIVHQLFVDGWMGKTQLRDYVNFDDEIFIKHIDSNHRKLEPNSTDYIHAHHLQVADVLLGLTAHSCQSGYTPEHPPKIGSRVTSKRNIIALPLFNMMSKTIRGQGFKNSGHYKAFTVSEVVFNDNGASFRQVELKDVSTALKDLQAELEF